MRALIHPKIEQVVAQATNIWGNIMPEKIFNDLVQFTGVGSFSNKPIESLPQQYPLSTYE